MALSHDVLLEELQKLMVQRESGALSGEEFERYAAALLSGSTPTAMPPPRPADEARPQSMIEKPPQRQTSAWTATPTAVPTVPAQAPPDANPTAEASSGSVPTPPPPTPSRARTTWSAVPGPSTTANQSSPGSNLWSAVPASGISAAPPELAPPNVAPPELAPPDLEPLAAPSRDLNGRGRKSTWAAQPQGPTEEPRFPPSRERGRRRLRRAVDPDSKLVSDRPRAALSPEVKSGPDMSAPAAGEQHLSGTADPVLARPTNAFTAVPVATTDSGPVVEQPGPPKEKGKGRLLRRALRPAVRSSGSVEIKPPPLETPILPLQAPGLAPSEVAPAAETVVETKPTDGRGEHHRNRRRPSFSATPNSDTSAESAEAEVPEATSAVAQPTLPDPLETAEPIASEAAGSKFESGALGVEDNALIAPANIEELLVPETMGSDLPEQTAMADVSKDFKLSIEVSAEERSARPEGVPAMDLPAASAWVFEPDPVVEAPGPAPGAEITTADVSSSAPAEPRAPRRHRKTGKHSQQKKRRDKLASTVIEEVPPRAEVLTVEPEREEGPLPASYWDLSRRILPELRPVGNDDGAPGIAPFSYWDLSERVLAPAPESDGEAQLDPEGYWSRSIKE